MISTLLMRRAATKQKQQNGMCLVSILEFAMSVLGVLYELKE